MTLLAKVREAAFWSQHICLDCSTSMEVDTGTLDTELTAACPECGGVMRSAEAILEILDKVETEE